jgi:aminopeptidase N
MRQSLLGCALFILFSCSSVAGPDDFTRADSLRGGLTPFRTCYDIRFYHLDVRIDPSTKSVQGSNSLTFLTNETFQTLQVDLFPNMNITKVAANDGSVLNFRREHGAVFVTFPRPVRKGDVRTIRIEYGGQPVAAERPPWSGGFIWTTDGDGNPWIAVACQGTGASLWWPNKDHQADEPDSMLISVTVPKDLIDVSNGRLRRVTRLPDGWSRFDWFVANPINNYNVTINIGRYEHFSDAYTRRGKTLTLDYYVLPANLERAKKQFAQVKPMLDSFEKYFGDYPFEDDGFKLIETPYLGMEHQSAIAYGNQFLNGYAGTAQSAVGPASKEGLLFDFIIIHEAAHEWWGNSVTSKDIADMWIHESFGAYAEALYVEDQWGREAGLDYVNAKKAGVQNTEPVIGVYGVNNGGSRDMYNKGQLILNTLRSVVDNDDLWFSVIKGLATDFRHQTVTAEDVFGYTNAKTGRDLTPVFDQYFRRPDIPQLDVYIVRKGTDVTMQYRWIASVKEFNMPVKVTTAPGTYEVISPTTAWQTMTLGDLDPRDFRMADDLFYATLNLEWAYLDPGKADKSYIRR